MTESKPVWTIKNPDGSTTCIGHIIDVVKRTITKGEVVFGDGVIKAINAREDISDDAPYYLPGFIDSHVHIESTMMLPIEFACLAAKHGSVGAICDPHEIANVMGKEGIELMLESAKHTPFHLAFGVPSCVPSCSTDIETSGYILDSKDVAELIQRDDMCFLAEMMNFPGVLNRDPEVMAKIKATLDVGKPVDGHAPGLRGETLKNYIDAGISTDHECTTLEEGRDSVKYGMMVQIREGSAAKDYEALSPLIDEAPDMVMFCTDDCHPTELVRGHINSIVARSIDKGYDLMNILQAACVNPVKHYQLNVGLLQVGDPADFIAITDITPYFKVIKTYIRGEKLFSAKGEYTAHKMTEISETLRKQQQAKNNFHAKELTLEDIAIPEGERKNHMIIASDGSLFTQQGDPTKEEDGIVNKLVVYNRYNPNAKPQVAYIKGFNIKDGALAQSVAHDCHNIIAVGSSDKQLLKVINRVIDMNGGLAAINGSEQFDLPLPIAGLISKMSGHELASRLEMVQETIRKAGCKFVSPSITLSFMALPVIPQLKLTDKGLFDSETFSFV